MLPDVLRQLVLHEGPRRSRALSTCQVSTLSPRFPSRRSASAIMRRRTRTIPLAISSGSDAAGRSAIAGRGTPK